MSIDDKTGRVKEAAGDLMGDQDLKNEGKIERAEGAVKDVVDKVTDKVKDVIGKK